MVLGAVCCRSAAAVRWRGQSHKPSTVVRYRRPLWEVVWSPHRQNGSRLVPTHGRSSLQEEGGEGNHDHAVDGGATVAEYEHVDTALDGGTGHTQYTPRKASGGGDGGNDIDDRGEHGMSRLERLQVRMWKLVPELGWIPGSGQVGERSRIRVLPQDLRLMYGRYESHID